MNTLITVTLALALAVEGLPPTTRMQRLIFVSTKASWRHALATCSQLFNGSLVTDNDEAVTSMISAYKTNQWASVWTADVWIGLFVSNIGPPLYKWTSSCASHDDLLFSRFDKVISLKDNKTLCVKERGADRIWVLDSCLKDFVSICEEDLGLCTYEQDDAVGACTGGIVFSANITVGSMAECEDYCSSISPSSVGEGQCWSITYVQSVGACFPALDNKPYQFDKGGQYEVVCTQSEVLNEGSDSKISWKRCFQDPEVYNGGITVGMTSDPYHPNQECPIPLRGTTATPQNLPGFNITGFNITGFNITEFNITQFNITEFNITEFNTTGFNITEFNITQFNITQFNITEFNITGFNITEFNITQFNITQFNTTGISTTGAKCTCSCVMEEITIAEKMSRLQKEIAIKKHETSSYIGSHQCATDNRISAKGMGMGLGVGVLVGLGTAICLMDIMAICKALKLRAV